MIPTFEEAARRYHETVKASSRNGKHTDQWLSTLVAHAFPTVGAIRVDHIDAPTVQSVLLPIWLTLPETARRVWKRIGSVLDFAHGQEWRATETPRNAIDSLMKRIKQPRRSGGFAAMAYPEVPALMGELRAGTPTVGRLALQFLILTAARSSEVRGALWGEIDLDTAQWNIPAGRTKAGTAHSVPLTSATIEILRQVREVAPVRKGLPIFPGLKGKPLSDATLAKVLRVEGGGSATVHGMRSAFRDWIAEQTSFPATGPRRRWPTPCRTRSRPPTSGQSSSSSGAS